MHIRCRFKTMITPESPAPVLPMLSHSQLAKVLGHPARWKILRELARGEGLLVVEVSVRVGVAQNTVSKHMRTMREAGLVVVNRAGMYSIPPDRLISSKEGVIDYGSCLLRLASRPA